MRRVYLGPRLGRDINRAADFYKSESAELSLTFLGAFGDAVRMLRAHPRIGSPLFGAKLSLSGIRAIATKTFPYLLFYTEVRERLVLVRLLHMSRNISAAFHRR